MKPKIYLISDSHIGHKNMVNWALRPENFEEKIINGILSIPEGSVLIHLGDVTLGGEYKTEEALRQVKAKKWLVRGNHDNHSIAWYLEHGWDAVCDEMVINMFGHNTLLSHIPVPKREGITRNIHGHLHGSKSHPRPDFYDEKYHVEVCPEVVGYLPVILK